MAIRRILALAFMLCLTISVVAQQIPDGYNPFVPVNLDDPSKLPVTPVVESSFHRYWIGGDQNFTDPSTFVWYVENGSFGTYDTITDTWTPIHALALGSGNFIELTGTTLNGVHNCSEIWVRWDDNSAGLNGYIAVYERSADDCIVADQISGYKHIIVAPPEIWFLVGNREECADQIYSVTVKLNNVNEYSYPYRFTVSFPGSDGSRQSTDFIINSGELDASLQYTFDLPAVQDIDVTLDETYTVILEELRDDFGATGLIAPLGPSAGQFAQLILTIYHLPQTGGMTMD